MALVGEGFDDVKGFSPSAPTQVVIVQYGGHVFDTEGGPLG